MIFNAGLRMISLTAKDMESVINTSHEGNLDFDDAYQYAISQKYNLKIISLHNLRFLQQRFAILSNNYYNEYEERIFYEKSKYISFDHRTSSTYN